MAVTILVKEKIGELLGYIDSRFIPKIPGKGLSTNDYSTQEKQKLAGLTPVDALNSTDVNAPLSANQGRVLSESIAAITTGLNEISTDMTGVPTGGAAGSVLAKSTAADGALMWQPIANVAKTGSYNDLTSKPTIPAKLSDLTNDSGYQTASQVASYVSSLDFQTATQVSGSISSALSGIKKFELTVVSALPATGDASKIYLVPNGGGGNNVMDEYAYVNGKWEAFGPRTLDLSGYLQKTDIIPITSEEIEAIVNGIWGE